MRQERNKMRENNGKKNCCGVGTRGYSWHLRPQNSPSYLITFSLYRYVWLSGRVPRFFFFIVCLYIYILKSESSMGRKTFSEFFKILIGRGSHHWRFSAARMIHGETASQIIGIRMDEPFHSTQEFQMGPKLNFWGSVHKTDLKRFQQQQQKT